MSVYSVFKVQKQLFVADFRKSQIIFLKQGARRSRYAVRATLVLEGCSVIEISGNQEFLNQENKYDKRRTAAIRPGQLAFLPPGRCHRTFRPANRWQRGIRKKHSFFHIFSERKSAFCPFDLNEIMLYFILLPPLYRHREGARTFRWIYLLLSLFLSWQE